MHPYFSTFADGTSQCFTIEAPEPASGARDGRFPMAIRVPGEDINPASEAVAEVALAGAEGQGGGGGIPREVRGEDRPRFEGVLVIRSQIAVVFGGGVVDLRRGVVGEEVEVERDCVQGEED